MFTRVRTGGSTWVLEHETIADLIPGGRVRATRFSETPIVSSQVDPRATLVVDDEAEVLDWVEVDRPLRIRTATIGTVISRRAREISHYDDRRII